ncbi:MAG: aminotransferase class V-fold PLP-dependent enzyme [Flavobacteriaceae bacterium]|nr:aminotransferase class V-fold PLP-dependent enzyme [Flavobacteriaceae bacterium]
MKKLIEKISKLESISCALEPSQEQRDMYLSKVKHFGNDFINTLNKQKTFISSKHISDKFKITSKKKTIDEVITIYKEEIAEKGINPASGGHLGYIPGGGIYTAAISDYMVDITNEYAGMFYASPGAVSLENELINWMKEVFNYPNSAVGNLSSGGSIANLIALTTARDKHNIKGDQIKNSVIYISPQVHHCILKALRIIGLEDIGIHYLVLDEFSRINSELFREQIDLDIKNGLNPFMVIASAGTTDTGAVDPLYNIGKIANKMNLWYHIDAAYGGFFILTQSKKHLFKGIELSDSLVVDPHKGMFLPYGIGAVLIKDKDAVFQTHHYTADYMQDALIDEAPVNPADVSPELTKHFRGLRMWIPLQLHGLEPFVACLEEKLLLTTYFREKIKESGFQIGPEPDLSVSYFWFTPSKIDTNLFNKKLLEFIHDNGSIYFSSTILNKKFVIRVAVLSFRTKLEIIDKALKMIDQCLEKTINYFNKT